MFTSPEQIIGNTPIVRLNLGEPKNVTIFAKVEKFNMAGSVKDRIALQMINDAEESGALVRGNGTIVEATSGNTGVGLAMVGAARGYKVVLTMPTSVSIERRKLLAAYGARLILCPTGGMAAAVAAAEKEAEEAAKTGSVFYAKQFENKSNPKAHALTTGPEIKKAFEAEKLSLDYFVSGVGTGGTISGAGRFLKENFNKDLKNIAVEPTKSPLLSKGTAAPHGIQGIGANFVPANFDRSVVDDFITVADEEAAEMMTTLAHAGLHVGISSGAAAFAALKLAKTLEGSKPVVILTVLPDTGERYLSLFKDE